MPPAKDADFLNARLALEEPNSELARQLAAQLRSMGFRVGSITARGVQFAGTDQQLESAFGSKVRQTPQGATFEHAPQLPGPIAHAGVTVYLPTKPEFFP